MKLSRRRLGVFAGILIGVVILIILLAAPAQNKLNSGSTYGRAPDGYGAWYAFMSDRKTPVQRWQKPFKYLLKNQEGKSITFLRIYSNLSHWAMEEKDNQWIEKGNTLIILGVRGTVTEAPFSTIHESPNGRVKIETTRREKNIDKVLLGDDFGGIVWQEKRGKGRLIYATTPYLAANAYQDSQGNYEFLAQLVKASQSNQVFVDEYIHGYRDVEVREEEGNKNLFSYLAKTPLFPILIQGLILLIIVIWASNRRFGKSLILTSLTVNNSEAYIQALAAVLQKAQSSELILEVVGKEEQLQIQKALGLEGNILDSQSLIQAWLQQTGQPTTELEQLLKMQSQKRPLSDSELLTWMEKWQNIHRHLPTY
jgi:hypothetical protein